MALEAYDDTADLGLFVPDAGTKENARIIGIALFKKGFDVSTLTNVASTWTTGITAGDIVIINPVTGSFPEGAENSIPGIGRTQTEYSATAFDVSFRHKGVDANLAFYNKLLKSKEFGAGFVFHDNKMYIPLDGTPGTPDTFDVTIIDFFVRPMSDGEQLEGDRFLMANARWTSSDLPYSMAVPESLFPL